LTRARSAREKLPMTLQEQKHQVRDIGVRLFRAGSGEPVMFLHGAGGFPGPLPFFDRLAGRHQLFVPEHPGFGKSDNPPWIRNVQDMAMYYLDLIDGLGVERLHLIGHSLGGWIAAELAVRNCSRLATLTLLSPAGVRVKGAPPGDNFIWSPEEQAHNMFHDQKLAEQRLARVPTEEEAELQLVNRFMAAKLGWEPRWFNPALERWLHRITVPALVLWGAEDKLLPSRWAERWRELVPNIRVEIIPQCGHQPHVEQLDVAADRVLAFLSGR
jgi:pimeloyl-ACP methyl ester carboxylesterase